MSCSGLGYSVPNIHCAPSHTRKHGPGGGHATGRTDSVPFHANALRSSAVALGRLSVAFLLSLSGTLSAMAADSKLESFPGEKPLASDVLEWVRVNKPRLTADERALADGYKPRTLLQYTPATVPAALTAGADVTAK